jgi:hypothetical protein
MVVSSKEIMKRIAQQSLASGEISAEEYTLLASDLGMVTLSSSISCPRIDPKTGKVLNMEYLTVEIVDDTVFLTVQGKLKKIWRMSIEKWGTLSNPISPASEE